MSRPAEQRILTRGWLTATCGALVVCAITGAGYADPREDQARAAKIKAAFLLNFIRFTEWPDEAFESEQAPLVLTVLGRDPMGDVLDQTIAAHKAHGRTIRVQRLRLPHRDDYRRQDDYRRAMQAFHKDLRASHVLFIAGHKAPLAARIVEQLGDRPVLTVGGTGAFYHLPVMLSLYEVDERIGFCANVKVIERASVKVSSQLLNLAHIVESE